MNTDDKNNLQNFIEQLDKLPEPGSQTDDASTFVTCACGQKLIPRTEVKQFTSAVGVIEDKICDSCFEQVPEFCPIVCSNCAVVVARLEPGENKRKFKLEPKKVYHIRDCPVCNPQKYQNAVVESRLIEEELYEKANKRK